MSDEWNFDMSQAPRGTWSRKPYNKAGKEVMREHFEPDYIIAASKSGGVVNMSYWKPRQLLGKEKDTPFEERDPDDGWWVMHTKEVPPIAWMPWPKHPRLSDKT